MVRNLAKIEKEKVKFRKILSAIISGVLLIIIASVVVGLCLANNDEKDLNTSHNITGILHIIDSIRDFICVNRLKLQNQ